MGFSKEWSRGQGNYTNVHAALGLGFRPETTFWKEDMIQTRYKRATRHLFRPLVGWSTKKYVTADTQIKHTHAQNWWDGTAASALHKAVLNRLSDRFQTDGKSVRQSKLLIFIPGCSLATRAHLTSGYDPVKVAPQVSLHRMHRPPPVYLKIRESAKWRRIRRPVYRSPDGGETRIRWRRVLDVLNH